MTADGLRISEAFVAWLWEQCGRRSGLRTADGEPLQVIYPGRRVGTWGPDYRGAVLCIGSTVVRGDVEIHVRARDWRLHRHDADPTYDSTILHVVFDPASLADAQRHDGGRLPTLALGPVVDDELPFLLARWRAAAALPAPQPCLAAPDAAALLDRAGLARFQARTARFEGDLTCVAPAQALWTGLLEALGYARNAMPFRRLADRLPLVEAEAAAGDAVHLVALLVGESGLLPSQRGRLALDAYTQEVEAAWRADGRRGPALPLGWTWVGSRPGNQPVRRVVAASALLASPQPPGPLSASVLTALLELPTARVGLALRRLVQRPGPDYWRGHADFDRPLRRPVALLGAERAADATINVLLPWAAAVGRYQGSPLLERAAEAAYRQHPPLGSNQVTRHMARQVIAGDPRAVLTTACRQQGLIHVYQGWCEGRDCAACPAGRAGSPG